MKKNYHDIFMDDNMEFEKIKQHGKIIHFLKKYLKKLQKKSKTMQNPDYNMKKLCFSVFTLILFFGVGGYWLIFEYFNLPSPEDLPDYYQGQSWVKQYMRDHGTSIDNKSRVWTFKLGDGYISNFENIIIWLCLLWGFLSVIRFMRIAEGINDKQD